MHLFLICSALTLLGLSLPSSMLPNAGSDEWKQRLLEIARTYQSYGRVEKQYRWSPVDCMMPTPKPPSLHVSRSDDEATHGQKLYTVFARKVQWDDMHHLTGFPRRPTYLPPYLKDRIGKERAPSEVGQVVVKEAWEPVKVKESDRRADPRSTFDRNDPRLKILNKTRNPGEEWHDTIYDHGDALIPYAEKNGQHYQAGERHGLFIMLKVAPKTPGTDQGWVYATVAKDLKTVTAVGTIASCMKCHQEAKHDRLFGLK